MNVKLKKYNSTRKGDDWPQAKGTAPREGGQMGRYVRNAKGEVVRLGLKPA